MGFELLKRLQGAPSKQRDPNSVGIGAMNLNTNDIGGRVSIGAGIAESLGWVRGQRIGMSIGNEKDLGWARLSHDYDDGNKLRQPSTGSSLLMLCSKGLGDGKKHKTEIVQHKIKNGALYVKLPEWAIPKP